MTDSGLLIRDNYFVAFENFAEAPAPGVALRIFLRGSENETDLLLDLPGTVDHWQVDFRSYAAYGATAEDFIALPDAESYIECPYRIYPDSGLLRYFKQRTALGAQEQARNISYRHFSFACMEHQVDVVSADAPAIRLLGRKSKDSP